AFDRDLWCPVLEALFRVSEIETLRSLLGEQANDDPELEQHYILDESELERSLIIENRWDSQIIEVLIQPADWRSAGMAAYSQDLRERVIDAVLVEGMSRRAAAARFGVSESAAIKWVERVERTGSRTAGRVGGY